jgi:predicted GH43/DUF377 family glycosyl hydrolase
VIFQPRNAPYPQPIYATPRNATTGAGYGSGITCYHVTTDPVAGTASRVLCENTPFHVGGGLWCYIPTQAETDYENFAIHFAGGTLFGYGEIVQVTTSTEPMRAEVERLFGIQRWNIHGKSKILETDAGDGDYATWPWVVADTENSRLAMYYVGRVGGKLVIRRRVSLDGYDGYVWEATGTTVLESSVDGWDAGGAWCPIVWIEDGTWYMMYTSRDADLNNVSTGLATSPDGVTWTKSGLNPVIVPTLVWEDGAVELTSVIKVGSTYYGFYTNLSTVAGSLPLHARKIGLATSPDLVTWTKQAKPVFGENRASYQREPFLGYYSPHVFKAYGFYYMIVAAYGPHSDSSRFELWECKDISFAQNMRRRVRTFIVTEEHGFPNNEVDIACMLCNDIGMDAFSLAGNKFKLYFGCKHDSEWVTGLAEESDIFKATQWVPSIVDHLLDHGMYEGLTTPQLASVAAAGASGNAEISEDRTNATYESPGGNTSVSGTTDRDGNRSAAWDVT